MCPAFWKQLVKTIYKLFLLLTYNIKYYIKSYEKVCADIPWTKCPVLQLQ